MWFLAVTDRSKKAVGEERSLQSHKQMESFYKKSCADCVQTPGQ